MKPCTLRFNSAIALCKRRLARVGTQSGSLNIRRSRSFIRSKASFSVSLNCSPSPGSSRLNSVFRAILLVSASNS